VGPSRPTPAKGRGPARKTTGREDTAKRSANTPRRARQYVAETFQKLQEYRDQDLAERKQRLKGATGRKIHRRRSESTAATPQAYVPKTHAKVHEPVTVRQFCAETGFNQILVCKTLLNDHQVVANINTVLGADTAQLLALELGIELEVVPVKSALELLKEEFDSRQRTQLEQRPPVVTMMGHVDHGKTSLLDLIRKSRVVSGEDGGITQHIGSYHFQRDRIRVTFLDTPGHAAFTSMRARGANLTDIVVLVVAADDGVMPQTVEAIHHAQAASVPIVVALNKIDLGRDNEVKIYGQLAEHELSPVSWGGETEVVATSAATGEGVDALLETLTTMSELMELKSDPTVPCAGMVIEAQMKTGVGPVVRGLVQDGTLHVGDILVCGPGSGKVRALLDDQGKRIQSAGPAMPVEIWGLSEVPLAGDPFYQTNTLPRAKQIASAVKYQRTVQARIQSTKVHSLEEIFKRHDADEVIELNVILKADVQGSVDALRQMLGELPSDKVKLDIRHSAVGAITDSDVLLACTQRSASSLRNNKSSPCADTIIVAFRTEPTPSAKRLAEQRGIDIRRYRVVYEVIEEITRAMEGLLEPEEKLQSRGMAQVREVFHVSKVGLVAGCYLTNGAIERSHLIKVVRDGVVVRDRCGIASLHHFKDDVKEARMGQECGILLAGFDDVHAGDTLESFEVLKIARTLV